MATYWLLPRHHQACLARAREVLEREGLELLTFPFGSGFPADHPRPGALGLLPAALRSIARAAPDVLVVEGWWHPLSWLAILARRFGGPRVVLVSDSTAFDRLRAGRKEAAKRLFLRGVDAAFAAGTRSRQYLLELGLDPGRVSLGADAIETRHFERAIALRPPAAPDRPPTIGTVARLVPVKNLEAAIRAVASFARREPLRWRIAGEGPLGADLRRLAAALEAPVEFAGHVRHEDLPGFHASLDVYWQPSLSETWGLAATEAAAAGLPLLLSERCGASADLVGPGNGWTHGPTELEAGLSRALADRARWRDMGAESLRRAREWDVERYASGLLRAVRTALSCGRERPSIS